VRQATRESVTREWCEWDWCASCDEFIEALSRCIGLYLGCILDPKCAAELKPRQLASNMQ
jgi:hypothetical protein